jgi:hypothetical protein
LLTLDQTFQNFSSLERLVWRNILKCFYLSIKTLFSHPKYKSVCLKLACAVQKKVEVNLNSQNENGSRDVNVVITAAWRNRDTSIFYFFLGVGRWNRLTRFWRMSISKIKNSSFGKIEMKHNICLYDILSTCKQNILKRGW